jgi:hypothetical protein
MRPIIPMQLTRQFEKITQPQKLHISVWNDKFHVLYKPGEECIEFHDISQLESFIVSRSRIEFSICFNARFNKVCKLPGNVTIIDALENQKVELTDPMHNYLDCQNVEIVTGAVNVLQSDKDVTNCTFNQFITIDRKKVKSPKHFYRDYMYRHSMYKPHDIAYCMVIDSHYRQCDPIIACKIESFASNIGKYSISPIGKHCIGYAYWASRKV